MNRFGTTLMVTALGLLVATGCKREEPPSGEASPATASETATPEASPMTTAPGATATLQGAPEDSDFSGTVSLTEEGGSVRVVVDLKGVDTPGKHAFHVHENGDCSHDTGGKHFTSAGGHFNPTGAEHACPPTEPRHAGDFGNIEVGADGSAHMETIVTGLSLTGANPLTGKAVILHAKEDDCKTQPTGDAGDRLACGVVK